VESSGAGDTRGVEFTERERYYLASQRLARLATVNPKGQPDVAAVGLHFDGEAFVIGGLDLPSTIKYRNVRKSPLVALTIDDLESVEPWKPRGIKIHGTAEIVQRGSREVMRVTPTRKWSWGINGAVWEDGVFRVDRSGG
jgi:pyridoxamine 5'-phosphate oxidase family protein